VIQDGALPSLGSYSQRYSNRFGGSTGLPFIETTGKPSTSLLSSAMTRIDIFTQCFALLKQDAGSCQQLSSIQAMKLVVIPRPTGGCPAKAPTPSNQSTVPRWFRHFPSSHQALLDGCPPSITNIYKTLQLVPMTCKRTRRSRRLNPSFVTAS